MKLDRDKGCSPTCRLSCMWELRKVPPRFSPRSRCMNCEASVLALPFESELTQMNEAWLRAWRPLCSSLRSSQCQSKACLADQRISCWRLAAPRQWHRATRSSNIPPLDSLTQLYNVRGFATHRSPAGQKTFARKSPSTTNAGEARFRTADLSPAELQRVFGRRCPPPHIANRLLRILQYRRLHGTLDLELPSNLGSTLKNHPSFVENGLRWLRKTYPVDEDAAILARIVKEEDEAEKAALDR